MHETVVHADRAVRMRIADVVANRPRPSVDARADASVGQPDAGERAVAGGLAKRRQRDHQLEGRAWRIRAVASAIEKAVGIVLHAFRQDCFGFERVERDGPRIARRGENRARVGIEHDRRGLSLSPARVAGDDRRDTRPGGRRRSSGARRAAGCAARQPPHAPARSGAAARAAARDSRDGSCTSPDPRGRTS